MSDSLLLRDVRIVRAYAHTAEHPVDVRIQHGSVAEVAPSLAPVNGERVLDAAGRWCIPGLWDHHVHMRQWAERRQRIDLAGANSARAVIDLISAYLHSQQTEGEGPGRVLVGAGFRIASWPDVATTSALDAVTGDTTVVLIAGDGHCGWLNSRAQAFFGLAPHEGMLDENEWFAVYSRLGELTSDVLLPAPAYRAAIADAHGLGIVGITDFEYAANFRTWPELVHHSVGSLRVRAGFYPESLDEVCELGLKTGDQLAPGVTLGPLKIIADGSLNTLTAYCCDPYGPGEAAQRGTKNYSQDALREMLSTATAHQLEVAVHAIGDAAASDALDAFAATGARGSLEHAQLLLRDDIARMAEMNIVASVQPAHLIDDFDVAHEVWSDRADRCYLFGSMLRAGVRVTLGSDAPVSPLDPWLAMEAAVQRQSPDGQVWNRAEVLTPAQALFASTNGVTAVTEGAPGDVVLLDHNPLSQPLSSVAVAATVVAGGIVFDCT